VVGDCIYCDDGYYRDGADCLPCTSPCATCVTSTSNCLTCESTYFLSTTGTCSRKSSLFICLTIVRRVMHLGCIACGGDCATCLISGVCLSCMPAFNLYGSTCVSSCPPTSYLVGSTCTPCDVNCDVCTSSTMCTTCSSGYKLTASKCYSSCPSGYFLNGALCSGTLPLLQTAFALFSLIVHYCC
jgi:proprotein convertase subtilisin/kexin type 5